MQKPEACAVTSFGRGQRGRHTLRQLTSEKNETNGSARAVYQTNEIFDWFYTHRVCLHKNVMVCKHCTPRDLRNVTLHERRGAFQIWCFDNGVIVNEVSFSAMI